MAYCYCFWVHRLYTYYREHKIHPLFTINGPGNEFQARILVALSFGLIGVPATTVVTSIRNPSPM